MPPGLESQAPLAVLLRPSPRPPPPPASLPIGRAALALAAEGVEVVFIDAADGGVARGLRPDGDGWRSFRGPVAAALDRYPSFTDPTGYHRLLMGLGAAPVRNPPQLTALLRDKIATQRALERVASLPQPALMDDPRGFDAALRAWGAAFLKPRFGSFGHGVERLEAGASAPARRVVDGRSQPMLLQRAVSPPPGLAGVSVRVLVQQTPTGPVARTPVARLSRTDPVVNRARGAALAPASQLGPEVDAGARALGLAVLEALPGAIELGVDVVVDAVGGLHLIEVNARPRGRLAGLAAADAAGFEAEHAAAVEAPLRWLAHALKAG